MYERYVTSPDGTRWVVGRRWLFGRPRYRGFKFGRGQKPHFESPRHFPTAAEAVNEANAAGTAVHQVRRSRPMAEASSRRDRRAVYRDMDDKPWLFASGYRRQRRSTMGSAARMGEITAYSGRWGGGSGGGWRGSGGRSSASSSGGRARGASGGSGRGSSGGGKRGGGAAAAGGGGLAALGPVLLTALKWIVIIAVIAAIAAFAIFVALPLLLFLLQLLLVGLVILWRELTGRPYIVEARETRPAPNVLAWKVVGFKQCRRVIDEVAEALRRDADPQPANAERVTLTER